MARIEKNAAAAKTLKERFGDDKQKFQQAMMEILQEGKDQSIGGCLHCP